MRSLMLLSRARTRTLFCTRAFNGFHELHQLNATLELLRRAPSNEMESELFMAFVLHFLARFARITLPRVSARA